VRQAISHVRSESPVVALKTLLGHPFGPHSARVGDELRLATRPTSVAVVVKAGVAT
jgi:hypothetical protein